MAKERNEWEDFVRFVESLLDRPKSKSDSETTPSDKKSSANTVCGSGTNCGTAYTTFTELRPDGEKGDKPLPRFVEKVRLSDSEGTKSHLFVRVDDDNLIHIGYTCENEETPDDYFLDLTWDMSSTLRGMLEHAEYVTLSKDVKDTE